MWIITESGNAADISKAVMVTFAERETGNKKIFAVTAKFGTVNEGFMRFGDYGEFYESEIILQNFTTPAEAKKYIADLVKKLNGEQEKKFVTYGDVLKATYGEKFIPKKSQSDGVSIEEAPVVVIVRISESADALG